MTVENTNPIQHFTANGISKVYSFNFLVEGKDNLVVSANEVTVDPSEYSYIEATRSIEFNTVPTVGTEITVERKTALTRSINYQTYDNSFRPETLNYDFDRIWRVLQEKGIESAKTLSGLIKILEQLSDADRKIVEALIEQTRTNIAEDVDNVELIIEEAKQRKEQDKLYNVLQQIQNGSLGNELKNYFNTVVASQTPNVFDALDTTIVFDTTENKTQAQINEVQTDLNIKQAFKNLQIISPLDYGAKGDGVTNDTVAIQKAIDSGYNLINLAGRTYKSDTLNMKANVTIENGTILLNTPNTTLISLNDYVTLRKLTLIGSGNTAEQLSEILVHGQGTTTRSLKGVQILDSTIKNSNGYACRLNYLDDAVCSGNHVENVRYAGFLFIGAKGARVYGNKIKKITCLASNGNGYGITFTSDSLIKIADGGRLSSDCSAVGNIIEDVPSWNALDTHGGYNLVYSSNVIRDCGFPIGIVSCNKPSPETVIPPKNVVVFGNTIEYTSDVPNSKQNVGISVSGEIANLAYAENISVSNNVLKRCGAQGNNIAGAIKIASTRNCAVTGNTILQPYVLGICIYMNNEGLSVTGNTIVDPHDSTQISPSGIAVRAHNNKGIVNGNTVLKSNTPPSSTYVGVSGIIISSGATGNDMQMGVNFCNTTTKFSGFANTEGGTDLLISEITDSTTGTGNNILQDVGSTYNQVTLNNNFADLALKLNQIVRILERLGVAT